MYLLIKSDLLIKHRYSLIYVMHFLHKAYNDEFLKIKIDSFVEFRISNLCVTLIKSLKYYILAIGQKYPF